MAAAVQVSVPATSANLGPGFDALGLALDLRDEVTLRRVGGGLEVSVDGEGAADVSLDERHLVVRAARAAFDRLGAQPAGLALHCRNRIPQGRGLGSSAAAICAGVTAAWALAGAPRDDGGVLALATELEGHPDNVAACLRGGLTLALSDPSGVQVVSLPVAAGLRPVLLVPPGVASTAAVRRLLPPTVPHADAALGAARAALLVHAIAGRTELLALAAVDVLHEPYRAAAMPETAALVRAARQQGLAAVVSGAGPTVLVLARDDAEVVRAAALAPAGWLAAARQIDMSGARVLRREG